MANSLEVYSCKVCTKTFSRLCKLNSHMHEHTTEKSHIFWDIFSPLPDYTHTQQYGERKSLACTVCTESCVNEVDYARNMQLIHEDEAKDQIFKLKKVKRRGAKKKAQINTYEGPSYLIRNVGEVNVDRISFECDAQHYGVRKPFSCTVCNESFESEADLETHFQLSHEDKEIVETLKTKVPSNSSNKVYFECEVCKQRLTQKSSLRSHLRKHTGERPYKCKDCKKTFTFYQCLWNHARKHTGEKRFKCDQCTKRYVYYQSLWCHKKLHSSEKPFVCDICGIKFALSRRLKCHLRQHTNEEIHANDEKEIRHGDSEVSVKIHLGVKPFECMVCKRRFGSNSSLQSHKMQHTDNRSNESKILKKVSKESQNMVKSARLKLKKLKQCDICNKIFTYTKCLIKHLEKHEIDKCYKCDVCGKEFAKYAALKTHLSLHTGERPHVCLVCGMSFIEYFSLWKHKREHTRDKTYACGVCGKIFSQLSNLNSHVRVHTPEDLNGGTKRSDLHHELKTCKKAPEEMKFQCKIDENKKENSTRHRTQALKRIASGKKLFACKDCERKFKRKGWLTRHYSTVHKHRNENYNNKKYTCEQCGAVFASEDDIINHQKCLNCMKCGKEFKCSYLFCFHNSPHLCQSSSQEFGDMNEGSEKPLRENYSINAVNEIKETLGMDNIYPRNQEELDSLDSEVVDELDYHIVVSSNAVEEISEPQALPDAAIYSDYGNCIETCNSSGEWLRFEYKSVLPAINNTNIGNRMSMSEWENMYIIENTASTPQEWGVWEVPYANKAPCTYHHMEHYANNGTHPCVICGLVFSTVTDLTTHAMGHITIV